MSRVLIVDSEPGMCTLLRTAFTDAGFAVYQAGSTEQVAESLQGGSPDLLILDALLPGQPVIGFLKALRQTPETRNLPVMMLSANGTVNDRVQALEAGADDCLSRPFSTRELLLRARALLRRRSPAFAAPTSIVCKDLILDPQRVYVSVDDQSVHLTPTEYALLYFFLTNQERAISRAELAKTVWGPKRQGAERTLDVYVRRLRLALAPYGYDRMIQTVPMVGYRFSPLID